MTNLDHNTNTTTLQPEQGHLNTSRISYEGDSRLRKDY